MKNFAFVPQEVFDENIAESYLPSTFSHRRRVKVDIIHFESYNLVGVFDITGEAIEEDNPFVYLFHQGEDNKGDSIYAYLEKGKLYVLFLRDKDLVVANRFCVKSKEDVLYYFIAIMDKSAIPSTTCVKMKILDENRSDILELLEEYLNVENLF